MTENCISEVVARLQENTCFIDGRCYYDYDEYFDDECLVCDVDFSASSFKVKDSKYINIIWVNVIGAFRSYLFIAHTSYMNVCKLYLNN